MPLSAIILLVLLVLIATFAIGSVVWIFIEQHLQTKRYIEWVDHLDKNK